MSKNVKHIARMDGMKKVQIIALVVELNLVIVRRALQLDPNVSVVIKVMKFKMGNARRLHVKRMSGLMRN